MPWSHAVIAGLVQALATPSASGAPATAPEPTVASEPAGAARAPAHLAPRVMVWSLPGAPAATDDDAVVRRHGFTPLPTDDLRSRLQAFHAERLDVERETLELVERSLEAAQVAYLEQRWDDMIGMLTAAEEKLLPVLAQPRYAAALWDVEFRLGLGLSARGHSGDADTATEHYALALALDPERRPPRELYGPDVLAAFVTTSELVAGRPPRPLTLDLDPPDALVAIDGHPLEDRGPLTLRPGLHVVFASAPGFRMEAVLVDTTNQAELALHLSVYPRDDDIHSLGVTASPADMRLDSPSAVAALDRAATAAGADVLVVVAGRDDAVVAQPIVAGKRGKRIRADDRIAAVDGALAQIDPEGRLVMTAARPTKPVVPEPKPPDRVRKPVAKTWWFWTIIGVVVATGVGLGLGLGLAHHGGSKHLVITGP